MSQIWQKYKSIIVNSRHTVKRNVYLSKYIKLYYLAQPPYLLIYLIFPRLLKQTNSKQYDNLIITF